MRNFGWLSFGLFLLLTASSDGLDCACAADRPPNIVVFLVDDLGQRDLGCYGSTFYETPHIDRLAADAMKFTQAYSNCPVCSPTRASLMTGRYPQRCGITDYINNSRSNQPEGWTRNTKLLPAPYEDHLALDERTIAEELRDAGYATFFAGKWHMGREGFFPTDQGFDVNKGGRSWGAPKSYFSPYGNPNLSDGAPGESLTLRLGEEACEFIETSRDRPFLVYLSFYSVHTPLQGPERLVEKYDAKAAKLESTDAKWGKEHANKVRLVQDHPTYAAMVEETDNAVGLVLDKLKELGLTDNTIVLFTSDNGGLSTSEAFSTSNVPLRAGKGWMYEGGIRVASIFRWPGVIKAGSECATPIISFDYFPTLLDAAGKKMNSDCQIDGVSIMPLLRGEKIADRALFWDYPHYGNQGGSPASAVRDGKLKLIEWREDDSVELYDVVADPSETKNLASHETETVERLRQLLHAWRKSVGAKTPKPNPNFKPNS
jgi:arylsulfatase A-like enzyme